MTLNRARGETMISRFRDFIRNDNVEKSWSALLFITNPFPLRRNIYVSFFFQVPFVSSVLTTDLQSLQPEESDAPNHANSSVEYVVLGATKLLFYHNGNSIQMKSKSK